MIGDVDAEGWSISGAGTFSAAGELGSRRCNPESGTVSVLLVHDRAEEAAQIISALDRCRDTRFIVDHVTSRDEALRLWEARLHDIAIFDIWLGRGTSIDLLASLAGDVAARPVVVLSNLPNCEARSITGAGCDFLVHSKENLSPTALAMTLCSALALARRMAVTFGA